MIFKIKCSNKRKVIEVFNILQSHIINSPEDANIDDCIIFFDINDLIIPIYQIGIDMFINEIAKNNIIEFNNSTMLLVLEYISDSLDKQFYSIDNNIFQLDY